jgi:hypothetical protein
MKKNVLWFLSGAVVLGLFATALVGGTSYTGYFSYQFTTPTLQASATIPVTTQPATQTLVPTNTLIPTRIVTNTPALSATATPYPPDCKKPSEGENIRLGMKNSSTFYAFTNSSCLMVSSGGGTRGHAMLGTIVNEEITINGVTYDHYYSYDIPMGQGYQASLGIKVWNGITFFERGQNGIDWANQSDEYWFIMQNVNWMTKTATAAVAP